MYIPKNFVEVIKFLSDWHDALTLKFMFCVFSSFNKNPLQLNHFLATDRVSFVTSISSSILLLIFKNDVSSLRFELFNEIDIVDEMRISLIQLMKKLNEDLQTHFDFEQIKLHLNNQKT